MVDAADRRFTSWLAIAFGPLFVLGGFLAAFTIEGAIMVWLGCSMAVAGVLLRTRIPLWAATAVAIAIFALLTTYTFTVYP